jgi:hypothetical protein
MLPLNATAFKIGDVVRCVDDSGMSNSLTYGTKYIVLNVSEHGWRPKLNGIFVINDFGTVAFCYTYRFESVT